jgi:NADH-quinone oxidoreductase subunit L
MSESLYLWLIPLLPLAGAVVNGLFGRRFSRPVVAGIALTSTVLTLALVLWIFTRMLGAPEGALPHIEQYAAWIAAGDFSVGYGAYLDQLSMLMLLVVTGVGFLIHVYAVGYMWEEGGFYRFFSYMNLFMFFMLTLVLANNYLLLFVGWEGVGLASYLLIGFFFRRDSAARAGMKAFIVNRIGDFGFLIALFLLIRNFGSLNFDEVFRAASAQPVEAGAGVLTAIGLLLLAGACGKSAQIPLYVWLPDAMEGPTPVSAFIHAATMVTAGVYMMARSHVIFDRAPIALTVVACIGAATALFAATIGLVQHDIKRVLAYSTVSQLGYMVLACGVAAYSAAMFHLMTHAFFKALLFLAAGSVIHGLSGEQDMRRMGGLRHAMPWTFWTMTIATFAIAGVPPLAGFFSKDEILWRAYSSPFGGWGFWLAGLITALLTAFYMFRLWFLTFFGEFRGARADAEHAGREEHHGDAHGHSFAHESPKIMTVPLLVLAVLSIIGGWIGVPAVLGGSNHFEHFLAPVLEARATGEAVSASIPHQPSGSAELALTLLATGTAALGIGLAWLVYYRRPGTNERIKVRMRGVYGLLEHKYYVDELYRAAIVQPLVQFSRTVLWRGVDAGTIDAAVNDSAIGARALSAAARRMQSGNIRSYAGWVAAGAAAVVLYMIYSGVR